MFDNKCMVVVKFFLYLASFLFLGLVNSHAATISDTGLDEAQTLIDVEIEAGRLAGGVTIIAQGGKILRTHVAGYRDIENQKPMTEDTFFRVYSMSKPITGTGLMILYQEGKFQLNDPVAKYIPEFENLKVLVNSDSKQLQFEPANHAITIHELLTHSAGFVYIPPYARGKVAELYGNADVLAVNSSLEELIEKLSKLPLAQQPGTKQAYSLSVDIQGYLIQVLSGQKLDVFLEQKIFTPLKMSNTGFSVPAAKSDMLSRRYQHKRRQVLTSAPNQRFLEKPGLLAGGNGLVSTAKDYYRFLQMHLNGGELDGVRLLSEDTINFMHNMTIPESVQERYRFYPGNELRGHFSHVVEERGNDGLPLGSYWWWGLIGTWFWIDPSNDIVFLGMVQIEDFPYTRNLVRKSRKAIYQNLEQSVSK